MDTRHRAVVNNHKHSSRIEGLSGVISKLMSWEEINAISIGGIKSHRSSSGNNNSVDVKVVRWTITGSDEALKKTGILCLVRKGSSMQEITLFSKNLSALKHRLLRDPSINAEALTKTFVR